MTTPKIKPTMPSMRLLVRAWAILPSSIAFTVAHAKKARKAAGISRTRNRTKNMLNGKKVMLVGDVGKVGEAETDAAKINPKIMRPIMPIAAAIT